MRFSTPVFDGADDIAIEDALADILDSTNGSVPINLDGISDRIKSTNDRIQIEQDRLTKIEERLILKFARLERTLSTIQQQFW